MDVARLKSIRLFQSFSADDLRMIAPFAEERSVPMRLITLKTYAVKRMERTLPQAVDQLRQVIAQRRNT